MWSDTSISRRVLNVLFVLVLVGLSFVSTDNARGGPLSLTADGVALGFGLSTFADSFPTTVHLGLDIGPLGVGFNNAGGVLVSDRFGDVRLFADVDGQHANMVVPSANYGDFSSLGIENANGHIYMATHVAGAVVELNANGTLNRTVTTGISTARDLVYNPLTGHLLVSGDAGIYDVDPVTGAKTLVLAGSADGIALDGTTLYAARSFNGLTFNSIQAFDITTWAKTFDSGVILGVDGIAFGFGSLSNKIFGNTNFGELWQVDVSTGVKTLIGSGGSRGDMLAVDPSGESLLLTQSDRVLRLTAPPGGSFSPISTPEPTSLALAGFAGLGMAAGAWRRRRQQKQAA